MNKRKRRWSMLLLAIWLACSGMLVVPANGGQKAYATNGNAATSDMPGMNGNDLVAGSSIMDIGEHWAKKEIVDWIGKGLAQGYGDGNFRPEQKVTRAEFVALVNRMYGYTERAAISFSDVASHQWYAVEAAKAVAAGYVSGYEDNTFRPNNSITRQEAAAIIGRLPGLKSSENVSVQMFKDSAAIPSWSQGAITAVVDQGYMKGYPDGTFRPAQPITRAEAIVALDQTAVMKIVTAGAYGPNRQVDTIHGNVIITSPDVTLQNVRITGNLLLAQSVGEGDVTLKGIVVEGLTIVSGGGEHSVHVIDSQLFKVIVNKKSGSVRIVASGSTNIDQALLESGAALESDEGTESGFGDVTIAIDATTGNPIVRLSGNFTSVIIDTPNVSVDLQSGSITELKVNSGAANAKLNVAETANVSTMVLDSNTEVTGNGNVKHAMVNVNGSTFDRKPEKLETAEGVTVEVYNQRTESKEPAGNGSNGGNNDSGGNNGDSGDNGNSDSEVVKPTVASVANVADVEVVYGTTLANALSALAKTSTITDSDHATHTVNLNWTIDGYNGNQAGVYTATGTFALPTGIAQANPPVPLKVTAKVTVKAAVVPPTAPTVVSVTYVPDITVNFGTSLADAKAALAQTITVTDSVYATHVVNLSWAIDGYDSNKAGVYTATGTFALPAGIAQANPPIPLKVTAKVTVKAAVVPSADPTVVSVAPVQDIAVDFGTSLADAKAALALTTTITDSDHATHVVNLSWTIAGYDSNKAGVYTATGTFALPAGVAQANPPIPLEATAKVTVKAAVVPPADPTVVSVAPVQDIAVGFGTSLADAKAALTQTTTVTDSVYATHVVNLNWTIAGYDGNQAGIYTATGTFTLPAGVAQADPPIALNVTANITVEDPYIVSITGVADIEVDFGTNLADAIAELANTTTIIDQAGATHTVNLNWTIDHYDGNKAGVYTATGTFALPVGVAQANPAVVLQVTSNATVKAESVKLLQATTSGYADEIVLRYNTNMSAPSDPTTGFTVMVDGTPNPVVSTVLDTTDQTKIHVGLTNPIPVGTVTISYSSSGLKTVSGTDVPAFSDVAVPTAGTLAAEQKIQGATATDVANSLKAQNFYVHIVTQALKANAFTATEIAAALKSQQAPIDGTGVALLLTDFTVSEVAMALAQTYTTDSVTVASVILPMAGTPETLVAALKAAGYNQPAPLAAALYSSHFTVTQAVAVLWSQFSSSPGQLGSALTDAGYSLSDAVAAALGLNGGNNTAAVAAAWPGVFGNGGALVPVGDAATSLQSMDLTVAEMNALLVTLYSTYKSDSSVRASALKTGGYDATDTARILESNFYQINKPGAIGATVDTLYESGYDLIPITLAIQTVYGADASGIATNVIPRMGVTDSIAIIQLMRQTGFGDNDVVKAALSRSGNNPNIASPMLHQAGYTAEQVTAMLKPTLGGNFNVTYVTQMLSSVDMSLAGDYNTMEIASVLQKVFGATAESVGSSILNLNMGVYNLLQVALALKDLYEIDGVKLVNIRNSYYATKGPVPGALMSDLDTSNIPGNCLLCILKDHFQMDVVDATAALHGIARMDNGSPLISIMNRIQNIYGFVDSQQKLDVMTQAGYGLAEIASVLNSGSTLGQTLIDLHSAGYSVEAVTNYLFNYYDQQSNSDITTTNHLISVGYGSCTNLESIIVAMRQVYGSTDARLLDIFFGKGCAIEQINSALEALGGSTLLPLYAVQAIANKPATQAINLLQEVFAKTDIQEIANILKQAGYNVNLTVPALKSTMSLSPSDAKAVLTSVFGLTEAGAITIAMKDAGYSVADIVPLLGTTDPLILAGYLQAANIDKMDALIQLYGPNGPFNDRLTLSKNLKALGVYFSQAIAIMQGFGYTPAEIGSLLWSNGYELQEVGYGVNQALSPVTDEFWSVTWAKTLKQMTACTGNLNNLPACSTGTSTFTDAKVVSTLATRLGGSNLDCSMEAPRCIMLFETMIDAGYSVPVAAGTLYTDFHIPLRALGYALHDSGGYVSAGQFVTLLSQSPFNLDETQMAESLRGANFDSNVTYDALYQFNNDPGISLRALRDAGYSTKSLGSTLMHAFGIDRNVVIDGMQALGYSYSVSMEVAWTLLPPSVDFSRAEYNDTVFKLYNKFLTNVMIII